MSVFKPLKLGFHNAPIIDVMLSWLDYVELIVYVKLLEFGVKFPIMYIAYGAIKELTHARNNFRNAFCLKLNLCQRIYELKTL